jgi:hypothetical protein
VRRLRQWLHQQQQHLLRDGSIDHLVQQEAAEQGLKAEQARFLQEAQAPSAIAAGPSSRAAAADMTAHGSASTAQQGRRGAAQGLYSAGAVGATRSSRQPGLDRK